MSALRAHAFGRPTSLATIAFRTQAARVAGPRAVLTAAALALGAGTATAQAGVGAHYGARDPRTCASQTAPSRGAIAAALAAQYFVCAEEQDYRGNLILVDDVRVQVGGGRPYDYWPDHRKTGIDTGQPVYAIRGSYVRYSCDPPHAATPGVYGGPSTVGANCRAYDNPHAEGECYKNTAGVWYCNMRDPNAPITPSRERVPPPR